MRKCFQITTITKIAAVTSFSTLVLSFDSCLKLFLKSNHVKSYWSFLKLAFTFNEVLSQPLSNMSRPANLQKACLKGEVTRSEPIFLKETRSPWNPTFLIFEQTRKSFCQQQTAGYSTICILKEQGKFLS